MEAFVPSQALPHQRVEPTFALQDLGSSVSVQEGYIGHRSRRRSETLWRGYARLRRRLLGMHDARGRATSWRAIYDEDEGAWDFYDEVGHYCLAIHLKKRPKPFMVDFIATIYEQGFEAGSRPRLDAEKLAEMRRRVTAGWQATGS